MTTSNLINQLIHIADSFLELHGSPTVTADQMLSAVDKACSALKAVETTTVVTEEIKNDVMEQLDCKWHTENEPASIIHDDQHKPWLTKAKQDRNMQYWERYRRYLSEQKNFPKKVIAALDDTTDDILDHTADPLTNESFDKRGMVVGHVQSGKTANYTGLICKAVDMGYRIVIVIAGLDNSLRTQTQLRLNEDFIGKDHQNKIVGAGRRGKIIGKSIIRITDPTQDFNRKKAQEVQIDASDSQLLFVVKKNVSVLRNLNEWLSTWGSETGNLTHAPMLVIDDEADHASINTKFGRDEETDPSATNAQIRKLLKCGAKTSFVAYTATPFANIFIDPGEENEEYGQDLFPRNFIIGLEAPENYLGGKKVFLDDSSHLKQITDHINFLPLNHKNHHNVGDVPKSLKDALHWYLLATAVRKLKSGEDAFASSMLIHVSRFKSVQGDVRSKIRAHVDTLRTEFQLYSGLPKASEQIRDLHEYYLKSGELQVYNWPELLESLRKVIKSVQVKLINGDSEDNLDYEVQLKNNQDAFFIAVGGQTLARGLTLEGLIVSYFLRNSKTYDTLMQMGRWFGYRGGYLRLVKIWMPRSTSGNFAQIATATDELFQELKRMNRENLSPREFGLRVRCDPGALQVTARNKLGYGEENYAEVSLEGKFPQVWKISKKLSDVQHNLVIAADLLHQTEHNKTEGTTFKLPSVYPEDPLQEVQGSLRKDVPTSLILDFIRSFKFPKGISAEMNPRLIADFVAENISYYRFDLYVPTLSIAADGMPLDHSSGEFEPSDGTRLWTRKITESENIDGFNLSSKSNILPPKSDGDLEALGLDLDRLKSLSKRDKKTGKIKTDSIMCRTARQGRNPLMMLFLLTPGQESCLGAPNLVSSFGITFPTSSSENKAKRYRVNRTYLEQLGLFDDLLSEDCDE